jgi:tRNA-dihydrouridine synthase A
VAGAGCDTFIVHARKAWLKGLSPKENREIPPLDYGRVHRLKARCPERFIGINGGIRTTDEAAAHLAYVDGVMFGRAAYHDPGMLAGLDAIPGDRPAGSVDFVHLIETMAGYAARHIARGGRLANVTRHMTGLFHGLPGARRYRQILSTEATRPGAGPEVLLAAFAAIRPARQEEAA